MNGEWGVGNGEWGVGSGEWGMGNCLPFTIVSIQVVYGSAGVCRRGSRVLASSALAGVYILTTVIK